METFEEAQQREGADEGGAGAGAATGPPFPRRKHAFRLVAPASVEDVLSSPMQPPNTSASTSSMPAAGGSSGHRISRSSTLPGDPAAAAAAATVAGADAAADGGDSQKGSWRTSAWSPGSCASGATEGGVGKAARQQVWVLAATNAKVSCLLFLRWPAVMFVGERVSSTVGVKPASQSVFSCGSQLAFCFF